MIIEFQGNMEIDKVQANITEVINKIKTEIGIADHKAILQNVKLSVGIELEDGIKTVTVSREIQGNKVDEPLHIVVALDEESNVKKAISNEEKSFYDDRTLLNAIGVEYQYQEIESAYTNDDIEVISHLETEGNPDTDQVMAVRYAIKGNDEQELIRYYKGTMLVSELLVNKEDNEEVQ